MDKTEQLAKLLSAPSQDLWDLLEEADEHVGEIRSQYGSEVSLYGDAWPGADWDVARAEEWLETIREALRLRGLLAQVKKEFRIENTYPDHEDLPF